jgi:hypothetical protein
MLELPRGVWRWIAENGRDLGRIAAGVERIADELAAIRKAMQDDEQKEQG